MKPPTSPVHIADHTIAAPTLFEPDGSPTWITRASHLVVGITQAKAGTVLQAPAVPDEHLILLPDAPARIECASGTAEIPARSLAIVPPGACRLEVLEPGLVMRAFSHRQVAWLWQADNAASHAQARADVRPFEDWPPPAGGFRLQVHGLDDALADGDKTRVFRCSNLMINVLRDRQSPRDTAALSPHAHEDFEQASITLSGVHIHHLRHPWTPDLAEWRPDDAAVVGAPSVTVIPPRVVHTTRNVGDGPALLVDLFAPPRVDFALRPGMVRNAADYPLPEGLRP